MAHNVDLLFSSPIVSGSGAKKKQNCSVELLGKAIYGDMRHGWNLPCIDPAAQSVAVQINDNMSEEGRQSRRWRLLICRLGTCHKATDRVERRMALWAARSVEHLSDDPRVKACNDATERWLADPTDENAAWAAWAARAAWAAWAAWAAEAARAAWAAWAAGAAEAARAAEAAEAAGAAGAAEAARAAWAAEAARAARAAEAAWAAWADYDTVQMDWYERYLDAWHKVAVDEGCAIPGETDAEYAAFLADLDRYLEELGR